MNELPYDPSFPVQRRDELLKQLETISKSKRVPFSSTSSSFSSDPRFSDWHDSFTDHGHWFKTWGKSGDLPV